MRVAFYLQKQTKYFFSSKAIEVIHVKKDITSYCSGARDEQNICSANELTKASFGPDIAGIAPLKVGGGGLIKKATFN